MTTFTELPFSAAPAAAGVRATAAGGRWLASVQRLAIDGACELVTDATETCAIVLSGTFDLIGGTTAWPSRGARTSPLSGRPVAVYLPPQTRFCAQNGTGEILLLAARQPDGPAATGREALHQSPLLPLAGSGKSYDPTSGEWRPAETFRTAPESLPPRRIERLALGGVAVERVFAADYKAATLTVDELVLSAGAAFAVQQLPLPERAEECLIYVRSDADVQLTAAGATTTVRGERALVLHRSAAALTIAATTAPAYVVLAHAGK